MYSDYDAGFDFGAADDYAAARELDAWYDDTDIGIDDRDDGDDWLRYCDETGDCDDDCEAYDDYADFWHDSYNE